MKVKWRILGLALALIAVWLFLIFVVFPVGSEGKENETFLPPGTAAVVYHEGMTYSIQSPNPEDVFRALMESKPSWWIGTGKWVAGGSAAAATFFYVAALETPAIPPFWIGKGGAAVLSATFSAIATVAGVSVIWVDNRRPKLTWEEAKFYFLSPEEQAEVVKFPDGKLALRKEEEKSIKYLLIPEFLVILEQRNNLPENTLLEGKILYFKGKPLLPSRKLEKEKKIEFLPSEILVIY